MIKNNENICIGITVWNGEKTIENSLLSLLKQNYLEKIFIVILDNRSDDKTVTIVKKLINKNKKKNIKIKLIIDKKKRSGVAAQRHLAKKYFNNYNYCMFAMDDDIYHKNFISSTTKELKKKFRFSIHKLYDDRRKKKKIKVRNKPIYSHVNNLFVNVANYIIYRNINPIFFGVYKSQSLLELLNFYNYFDNSS